jgi:energy-coupling factor transporter ATP-binding protein EcfA2
MKSSEECYQAFQRLRADLPKYPLDAQTEADTRARLIDRIIGEVLDWPPENILREENASPGFMDYVFLVTRRVAVLEAKKSGETFQLPHDITSGKAFTLNGIIRRVPKLQSHINQVTNYCFNNGIEYAIVSNGLQYVIFRAVRIDGIHIGRGKVIVFNGVEDVETRFVQFWELLSKSSVQSNSLQRAFEDGGEPSLQYRRPADQVHARNEKVTRNGLSEDLEPLINVYMGEITDESSREKLKNLFVRSKELDAALDAVGARISMAVSQTVRHSGRLIEASTIKSLRASVEQKVRKHVAIPRQGEAVLLLGRVGSGKTTFVNHFLRIESNEIFKDHLLVLLDFRQLEKGGSVHKFFYEQLRLTLSTNKKFTDLTSKELRKVYANEIRELSTGPLAVLEKQNKKVYEEKIAEYLLERYRDSESHYPRVLRFLADKVGIRCFLLFDNVDQHDFDLQQEIFQFAYAFSKNCHAFSIVTMWEETYLRSKRTGGALSAYPTLAYRLPSTSVVDIIRRRLEYVVDEMGQAGSARELISTEANAEDVSTFLGLVGKSILNDRKRARIFLESISMGNLRQSMDIFSSFLVSGHTDTGKILKIFRERHGRYGYLIPLHEFIKSIGLGDNRYYTSELSQVANVFAISDESRPSHFTKLRLLEYLFFHRNRASSFGMGFIRTDIIQREFAKFGTSEVDIPGSLRLLTTYSLVENDIYEPAKVGDAYRITPAGRYYLRYLCRKFSYLDLVCQDTPIGDRAAFDTIRGLIDNAILEERFKRVDAFVSYLCGEEEREHAAILNASDSMPLRSKIMPVVKRGFEQDHEFIVGQRRLGRKAEALKTPYVTKPVAVASAADSSS